MSQDDVTPIRQQYLDIKKQYPDTIVFFRLGDFYETFDHDAEITSTELDIVLTSRNVAKGSRIPMAGIPYHAVENYLSRLIDKGYHVAICEQVGEQPQKGIFPRQVVRVVTPGTVIEPALLHSEKNNYLLSYIIIENGAALCYVDITTGEFFASEFGGEDSISDLRSEISRLNPAEILIPDSGTILDGTPNHTTRISAWKFEPGRCYALLQKHFDVSTLDGFGLSISSLAVRTAGAVIQYLQDTQPTSLSLLTNLSTYEISDFMSLDSATRRNLELTETIRSGQIEGSLLSILDHTKSPMGKRLIRQWINRPLLNKNKINERLDLVKTMIDEGLLRIELRECLGGITDIERAMNRIIAGHAIPRDLVALRNTLEIMPNLVSILASSNLANTSIASKIDPCADEYDLLVSSIADEPPATLQNTGIIRPGYSAELDNTLSMSKSARDWIANLETTERERTGIKSLKVGFNRVFGYYLEVTHSNTINVPAEYIRKQTLVNAERYITPEMKEYETLVLNAEERIHEIEVKLFKEICQKLSQTCDRLFATSRAIADIDVLASFAEAAASKKYCQPIILDDPIMEIVDGRHPVVEDSLSRQKFIPNDTTFEIGEVIRIITGPNMSGKSTFLRQVALIALMAQIGSFVPATSARIGLVDRIFTRIGAQDEIHTGQSTFMVEMIETANILHHATSRSLLILDEIGRGTSTYDGLSIAWAIVEYIHNHPNIRSRTLFATHYHELTQLADLLPGVRNYNVSVTEVDNQVVFLHKIIPGGADRSYGIHVAQLAGIPKPVIARAGDILKQLEASSGKASNINPFLSQQMELFPQTNPMLDELRNVDPNSISPIEALNYIFEWKRKFTQ